MDLNPEPINSFFLLYPYTYRKYLNAQNQDRRSLHCCSGQEILTALAVRIFQLLKGFANDKHFKIQFPGLFLISDHWVRWTLFLQNKGNIFQEESSKLPETL
jgi:hypothetical protein